MYTIINEDKIYTRFGPYTGKPCEKSLDYLILQHCSTVFVEDKMHDCDVVGNEFILHTHSSKLAACVDFLIEFE